MSPPAKPLVLSPSTITSLPNTLVLDNRGHFSYISLFSSPGTNTKDLTAGIAMLAPNTGKLCEHHHPQTEIYYLLSGKGVVIIDGIETSVEGGSAVFVPGGSTHGIRNTGNEELRWLYVFPTDGFGNVEYTYLSEKEVGRGLSKL